MIITGNCDDENCACCGELMIGQAFRHQALSCETISAEEMRSLLPAWEDLCKRSIEDNVYYAPPYAMALQETVEAESLVRFAVVWRDSRLTGVLPYTQRSVRIPLVEPVGQAWQSKYTFSCTPVLDRTHADDAASGLIRVLASVAPGEWVLPTLNVRGPACGAMTAALDRMKVPWLQRGRFERASIEGTAIFEEYMERHLSPRRRRELARTRRKLEQLGEVEHHAYRCGNGLETAVAAFLKIEASGWKGKRGTALACEPSSRRFALNVFAGKNRPPCRADILMLDGRPIAAGLIVFEGQTGFAVKSAYDEAYRNCCAGLLLEVEIIRSFLTEKWAARLDAATAGTHVIDELWPCRTEVADLLFSLSPSFASARLNAISLSMEMRDHSKKQLKKAFCSSGQHR